MMTEERKTEIEQLALLVCFVSREAGIDGELAGMIIELLKENERLKTGKLNEDEFNALCHDLEECGRPITEDEHKAACEVHRAKLFGSYTDYGG